MKLKKIIISALLVLFCLPVYNAQAARLKDIAHFEGVRANQLIGYGLVVGLNGTGDKSGTTFTQQSLTNMLNKMGVQVTPSQIRVKNVAAVMVTATLPAFIKPGSKLDVLVSSLGDASSLQGGTLLITPLRGLDRKVYAVAQGPLSIGGFSISGAAAGVQKNHPTVGRVVLGATVERKVEFQWAGKHKMTIKLNQPDFTTAQRIADLVNSRLGPVEARPLDAGTVEFMVPPHFRDNLAVMAADLENINVSPDTIAKIIIDERTGTIVIGENVRISTVAVAHGSLTIQIKEGTVVSQPQALSQGQTVASADTGIQVQEGADKLLVLNESPTIADLVKTLNAIGATPRDLIVIFQAIKAAGALHAELEII